MNMIESAKAQVRQLTVAAYEKAAAAGLLPAGITAEPAVEIPKDTANGDYTTTFCLAAAKAMKMNPRQVAQTLIDNMTLEGSGCDDKSKSRTSPCVPAAVCMFRPTDLEQSMPNGSVCKVCGVCAGASTLNHGSAATPARWRHRTRPTPSPRSMPWRKAPSRWSRCPSLTCCCRTPTPAAHRGSAA